MEGSSFLFTPNETPSLLAATPSVPPVPGISDLLPGTVDLTSGWGSGELTEGSLWGCSSVSAAFSGASSGFSPVRPVRVSSSQLGTGSCPVWGMPLLLDRDPGLGGHMCTSAGVDMTLRVTGSQE